MKPTLKEWIADALGAVMLFALFYMLMLGAYVMQPCDHVTEFCGEAHAAP